MNDLLKRLENLLAQIAGLKQHLNLPQKEQRVLELEDKMQAADFWSDNEQAQKLTQEHSQLKIFYDFWQNLEQNTKEIFQLVQSNTDESAETLAYLEKQVAELEQQYDKNRFMALLSKKYDDHNAIFSLHAGAGGVDAQDWTEILLRMFLRYAESRGWATDIIEMSRGTEAGIKSVTVEVNGPYAYGLLKSEAGVHRLVRLEPV